MHKLQIYLEKPIAFYPQFVEIFDSIEAALYFQQIFYWSDKGTRKDGFIYKTKSEIEEETTITRYRQDKIRKQLEKMGVLETKLTKANGTPTLHYKLNLEEVSSLLDGIVRTQRFQSLEPNDSNRKNPTIPINRKTENTTESTTDIWSGKQKSFPLRGKKEKEKKEKEKEKLTDEELEEMAHEILTHFNEVYDKRYRSVKSLVKNLEYWLSVYSVDDIKEAIDLSKHDEWWSDKLEPVILLRRRNPNQERVDYIGKFLNLEVHEKPEILSDSVLWRCAKENNVPYDEIERKVEYINERIVAGTFHKIGRGKTPAELLTTYVERDLQSGKLRHCNEIEAIELERMHPQEVAKRKKLQKYKNKLYQQGVLD